MDLKIEYYYRILGIRPGASLAEIKSAYRYLAKIYHPDKDPSPDSIAMYSEIRTAYEKLMNRDNYGGIHTKTGTSTNASTGAKTSAGTGASTRTGASTGASTGTWTKSTTKTGTSTGAGAKTSTVGSYGKTNPTITYHREPEAEDNETEIDWLKYILSSLAICTILAALIFFIIKFTPGPMLFFAIPAFGNLIGFVLNRLKEYITKRKKIYPLIAEIIFILILVIYSIILMFIGSIIFGMI